MTSFNNIDQMSKIIKWSDALRIEVNHLFLSVLILSNEQITVFVLSSDRDATWVVPVYWLNG
jgi:hypothetical protein